MALTPFLAMTASEIEKVSAFPANIAWMACHFSPYGLGLSNLPKELPPGSLLIVDDITPPSRHDPVLIAEQLTLCAERFQCRAILLDFERQNHPETAVLTKHLTEALTCPTAVSANYAGNLACPVFLPPALPSVPLEAYFAPWKCRDIWLEIGLCGEILTLTQQGCSVTPLPFPDLKGEGFSEPKLHCHYSVETDENSARFTLWRNSDDIRHLLEEAESLGVTAAVGLFQELNGFATQ